MLVQSTGVLAVIWTLPPGRTRITLGTCCVRSLVDLLAQVLVHCELFQALVIITATAAGVFRLDWRQSRCHGVLGSSGGTTCGNVDQRRSG